MAKQKRLRQRHLPNTDPEPVTIKEIEDAADNYVEARDKRMNMLTIERERKESLRESMKKHKKYEYDGKVVEFSSSTEENVKVRTKKAPGEDDEGDE